MLRATTLRLQPDEEHDPASLEPGRSQGRRIIDHQGIEDCVSAVLDPLRRRLVQLKWAEIVRPSGARASRTVARSRTAMSLAMNRSAPSKRGLKAERP